MCESGKEREKIDQRNSTRTVERSNDGMSVMREMAIERKWKRDGFIIQQVATYPQSNRSNQVRELKVAVSCNIKHSWILKRLAFHNSISLEAYL